MNIIFTFNQTKKFSKKTDDAINKIDFSQIPEMKVIDKVDLEGVLLSQTKPYQANVNEEEFEVMVLLLGGFGKVDIIGKWKDNGDKITLNKTKYLALLKDVEIFEKAVFLDGEDYTNKEYLPSIKLDENGNDILDKDGNLVYHIPSRREFTRVKSTYKATKLTDVNTFNKNIKREL